MLDGRVKTLHPKIHGGILARRDLPAHMEALDEPGIAPIDLVVVNLYPFAQTIARADCTLAEAIENIDIGGPAMVRSAAKNYGHVAVVTDPADYAALLEEMAAANGAIGAETRFRLAQKAFSHTAAYDGAISNYLTALDARGCDARALPGRLNLQFELAQPLRYGENPHQKAAFYRDRAPRAGSLANYRQLQGKELSYNNIADADAAWECVKTFDEPACVIVKHANPCGAAVGDTLLGRVSEGVRDRPHVGVRRHHRVQPSARQKTRAKPCANSSSKWSIAPGRRSGVPRDVLAGKQNIRVLEVPARAPRANALDFKRVGGGLLVQTPDALNVIRGRIQGRHAACADEAQIADLLVRLAGGQVRQIERDRVLRRRAARSASARAR